MDEFAIETGRLFDLCDRENKGYLTAHDLKVACPQLDDEEIAFIFGSLDSDGSGKIDRNEFLGGFQNALCQGENRGFNGMKRRASVVEPVPDFYSKGLQTREFSTVYEGTSESESNEPFRPDSARTPSRTDEEIYNSESDAYSKINFALPCQEEVLLLYEQLQSSGMPQLLSRFEKVVGNFCKELKEQKDQNVRLQHVFESERESYSKRMTEVENELDLHILQTEKKVREEERKRLAREKEEMRLQMEAEMAELKENIARMQKMEDRIRKESAKAEQTAELKAKLQELSQENQQLKASLADSNLELAVIKSELVTIKADYESRKEEMLSDNEAILETAKQSENLQRQLRLLYDANKKLHDTNDSLREALDQRTVVCRHLNARSPPSVAFSRNVSSPSINERQQSLGQPTATYSTDEDADSGLSLAAKFDGYYSSDQENNRPIISQLSSPNTSDGDSCFDEANGPPERTFRIVMCGDASVGKSSIVTRIIKGVFTGNLPSTLGVDFHVKTARVDDKNVAIQLWDTAGQERFRSLCKSYFRRADGAILVYDCTAEQTFLRVRDWVDTIKESTLRPIPIMICANKIDLRNKLSVNEQAGFVSESDGSAMAAAMDVMFAECSALDGSNVEGALLSLTRELMTTEDVEIRSTGVVLTQKKASSSCCSRR